MNYIIEKIDDLKDKCITDYCGSDFESISKNVIDGSNGCQLSSDLGYKEYDGKCYTNDNKILTSIIENTYSSTEI